MEKILCLNCNKPVDISNTKGFHRCDCGTLNSMDAIAIVLICLKTYYAEGEVRVYSLNNLRVFLSALIILG